MGLLKGRNELPLREDTIEIYLAVNRDFEDPIAARESIIACSKLAKECDVTYYGPESIYKTIKDVYGKVYDDLFYMNEYLEDSDEELRIAKSLAHSPDIGIFIGNGLDDLIERFIERNPTTPIVFFNTINHSKYTSYRDTFWDDEFQNRFRSDYNFINIFKDIIFELELNKLNFKYTYFRFIYGMRENYEEVVRYYNENKEFYHSVYYDKEKDLYYMLTNFKNSFKIDYELKKSFTLNEIFEDFDSKGIGFRRRSMYGEQN